MSKRKALAAAILAALAVLGTTTVAGPAEARDSGWNGTR